MRLRQSSFIIAGLAFFAAVACGQFPPHDLPRYDLAIGLKPTTPRLVGEAIVTVPAPDTGHVSFVLGQMFNVESVELRVGNAFRRSRTDTAYLQGLRREWGYVRWRLLDDDASRGASRGPVTFRVRYRLDTAATSNVFGIGDSVSFGSGINTSWYPQIEDGRSLTVGRVRTKRGTGLVRFDVPRGTIVHAVGAPSTRNGGGHFTFEISAAAYFNFAAARFQVRRSSSTEPGVPTALTYYLASRDSAGVYASQSLAVLRALAEEFGPYPYDQFAIIELPTELAQRAGFGGASMEGAILTTTEFVTKPFNSAYYGHEIGHQWWGVTIRPTGVRGAMMLQEGMAQYGALRAVELIDGPGLALAFRQREYPDFFGHGGEEYFRVVDGGNDAPLADLPVNEQWALYLADSKGFMAMNVLSNEIGRDRLRSAFHQILREAPQRRLTWDDFVAAITKAAGRDLTWFFDQWFYRTGAPELAAELDPTGRQAIVRQLVEPYRLTLDVAFIGAGCPTRIRATVSAREERVPFPAGCRPDSVAVDPDYQVLRWTPELRQRYSRAKGIR